MRWPNAIATGNSAIISFLPYLFTRAATAHFCGRTNEKATRVHRDDNDNYCNYKKNILIIIAR
jgi:hypothetical protein